MTHAPGGDPDAVRVWIGFRNPDLKNNTKKFHKGLGEIFIPLTTQLLTPHGLIAYIPTVVASDNQALPDEIALVFNPSQKHYKQVAYETSEGRAYGRLHQTLFDSGQPRETRKSNSGFPKRFDGEIELGERYYLVEKNTNWQRGTTQVMIATFDKDNVELLCECNDLLQSIANSAQSSPDQLDGALIMVCDDYIIYWEHYSDDIGMPNNMDKLTAILERNQCQAILRHTAEPITFSPIFSKKDNQIAIPGDVTYNVHLESSVT